MQLKGKVNPKESGFDTSTTHQWVVTNSLGNTGLG